MLRMGDNSPVGTISALEPLAHFAGNTATGGVWRVSSGTGSAVLKQLTPNGQRESQWNYWRREPLAYRTGFLDEYCGDSGLSTPRLLDYTERDDGSVGMWFEDLTETCQQHWTVAQLGILAGQLGRAQAQWTIEGRVPTWLSRRFLRQYSGRHQFEAVDWRHPVALHHWSESLLDGLRRLWEQRNALFDSAEQLPMTVCHLDAWPQNLFPRNGQSVLIDWAFLGRGAVGEDIGNLIPDTVLDGLFDVRHLPAIRHIATESYIEGFRSAGGSVPEADIRRAIAITGAAKYVWLAPMMLSRLSAGHSPGSRDYDPDSETEAILSRRGPVFQLLLDWASQALAWPLPTPRASAEPQS